MVYRSTVRIKKRSIESSESDTLIVPVYRNSASNDSVSQNEENASEKKYSIAENYGNKGYVGYSMSVRASEAYENDEKPISKWTKTALAEAISEVNPNIDVSKLNAETLE